MTTLSLSAAAIELHRKRLLELLGSCSEALDDVERESLEGSGVERQTSEDEANEQAELDVDLCLLAAEGQLGREVQDALERIQTGRFGRCERCQRAIGARRLELVPFARECARCAGAGEAPRGAPGARAAARAPRRQRAEPRR